MCVATQAGVWDVDGTGMQAVDDPEVDLGIRKVGSLTEHMCIAAQHAVHDTAQRLKGANDTVCSLGWKAVHHGVLAPL